MSYRVFWSPQAERRLEEIAFASADRQQIANAAKKIDYRLVADPTAFGESRYDTVRVGFERPLAIQYDVLVDVRTVIVLDVWRIKRR